MPVIEFSYLEPPRSLMENRPVEDSLVKRGLFIGQDKDYITYL